MSSLGDAATRIGWDPGPDTLAGTPEGDEAAVRERLADARLLRACQLAGVPDDGAKAVLATARRIISQADLQRCWWSLYRQALRDPADGRLTAGEPKALGDLSGCFAAVAALAGVEDLFDRHRRLGVSQDISVATVRDIGLWMEHYRVRHEGRWGLAELPWLRNHLSGRLYRLGRLHFVPTSLGAHPILLRQRRDGQVIGLMPDGVTCYAGGFRTPTTGDGWKTLFRESPERFVGQRIRADGGAEVEAIDFPTSDWERWPLPEAKVLDVHIPAEGPLDPSAVEASFTWAREFFARHHPELPVAGFVCRSWLLDGQLANLLPATSNLVGFLRRWLLFPIDMDGTQTWERVFDRKPGDPAQAPEATSLQRAIKCHLLAGGSVRGGGGFLPA